MRILGLVLIVVLSMGCCPSNTTPPPIYTPPEATEESATMQTPPARSRGIDESRALDIASQVAESEGFNPELYSEVVIESAGDDWIVQMRRPHILRFIEVHVNKTSGAAAFRVVSNTTR